MPAQPYIDITGTTAYREATGNGTLSTPYIPVFNIGTSSLLTTQKRGYISTATITRAANTTAYSINDVYGNAFELTNIGNTSGHIIITSIDVIFNIAALPSGMSDFTLFLYSTNPVSAITDNNAYSLPTGDRTSILNPVGISLTAQLARGGGTVVIQKVGINEQYKLASNSTSLFAYLVTNNAFTPSNNSETATIRIRAMEV